MVNPPLPPGVVILILAAMQGHQEAPCLWERHADLIIRSHKLTPAIHKPCLYSGVIDGQHLLLLQQVDDFTVPNTSQRTADMIFNLIDDSLKFPLKHMGLVNMFNGLDINQTQDYVKVSYQTYIERITKKYIQLWLWAQPIQDRPTPFPKTPGFVKAFLPTTGDSDVKVQASPEKGMRCK